MFICIYCWTQTRPVTCYMTDTSSRQGGRPTTNKTAIVLTTTGIWLWVPDGIEAGTDWLIVNCKVILPLAWFLKELTHHDQVLVSSGNETLWNVTNPTARYGWVSWATLQLTVSRSVGPSWLWAPLRLMTTFLLKLHSYEIDVMGRLPWREDASVFFARPSAGVFFTWPSLESSLLDPLLESS
jgi:hypothetical protein